MPEPRPASRARRFAFVWLAWTAITMFGMASAAVRIQTGEIRPPPGWYWSALASIPLWALATPPLFALSRRYPIERGRWAAAATAHTAGLAVILAADGVLSWALAAYQAGPELTLWQAVWKYSFVDAFYYAGVVAVEHAIRYHRLY